MSNSISLRGDLISAMLDPAYTLTEVFTYWQQLAPQFPYLGDIKINKDELNWDHQRMIAVMNNTAMPPGRQPIIGQSGDAEILDGSFGVPVYQPGSHTSTEWIAAFMLPELPDKDNPVLYWNAARPITLRLTRNTVYETPYLICSLDINPGVWGYRHLQYQGIAEVYQCLQKMEGANELEAQTAKEAARLSEQLYRWETIETDFSLVREQCWTAAYKLVERFSKCGTVAVLHVNRAAGAPHDLSVSQPGAYRQEIPQYKLETFINGAWMEQMSWGSATRERAIAYWGARKTTPEWRSFYNSCMAAVKYTWPAIVKVLQQPPVSDEDMEELVTFLADINWPGAFEAYNFLQTRPEQAVQTITRMMEDATAQNNQSWLEDLQLIKSMITGEELPEEE